MNIYPGCNIFNHNILIEDCYVDNLTSHIGYFDNLEVFIITEDVVQIPHIHNQCVIICN